MAPSSSERAPSPLDRVVGGYLVFSALPLVFPHRPDSWPLLLGAHLGLAFVLLTGRMALLRSAGSNVMIRGLADWYPLVLLPVLYWELPFLNTALWGGRYFDGPIQQLEVSLFGHQPSVELSRRWASLWISEPLHLAYLSYYGILYVFPILIWIRRSRDAFRDTLFAMMLGFALHYAVFILFPVKGPYWLFPAPGEPVSSGIFYGLVQAVLAGGASTGAAFPSSHVAISAVQAGNALRHLPRSAPLMLLLVVGIMAGAVYAGIHYAVDVFVGLATGTLVALMAPRVRRMLT